MSYSILLFIPLALGGFVAFWCLIVKLLALAGWQRLATHFQTPAPPPGPRFWVQLAYVGSVRYQGVLRVGVSAEGLALGTIFLFRVGHPPLLIPWSAVGPWQPESLLWTTSYTTFIQAGTTSVRLSVTDSRLLAALRPWAKFAGPVPLQ